MDGEFGEVGTDVHQWLVYLSCCLSKFFGKRLSSSFCCAEQAI